MTDCSQTLADTKHFPGYCPKRHSYTMYEADVFWFGDKKAREQDDTQSRNPRHRCFLFSFSLTMELQEADNLGEEF